jgi:hypothetical protein
MRALGEQGGGRLASLLVSPAVAGAVEARISRLMIQCPSMVAWVREAQEKARLGPLCLFRSPLHSP